MPLFLHDMDRSRPVAARRQAARMPTMTRASTMNQRCHAGTGVRVEVTDDELPDPCAAVLVLKCQRCNRYICSIALTVRPHLVAPCPYTRCAQGL